MPSRRPGRAAGPAEGCDETPARRARPGPGGDAGRLRRRHRGAGRRASGAAASARPRATGAGRGLRRASPCRRGCRPARRRAGRGRPSRRGAGLARVDRRRRRRGGACRLSPGGRRFLSGPGRGGRRGRPAPPRRPRAPLRGEPADGPRRRGHPARAARRDGPRGPGDQRGPARRLAAPPRPRGFAGGGGGGAGRADRRHLRAAGGLAARRRAAGRAGCRPRAAALRDRALGGPGNSIRDRDRRRADLDRPRADRRAGEARGHRARADPPARPRARGPRAVPGDADGFGRQGGAVGAHSPPARPRGAAGGVRPPAAGDIAGAHRRGARPLVRGLDPCPGRDRVRGRRRSASARR